MNINNNVNFYILQDIIIFQLIQNAHFDTAFISPSQVPVKDLVSATFDAESDSSIALIAIST